MTAEVGVYCMVGQVGLSAPNLEKMKRTSPPKGSPRGRCFRRSRRLVIAMREKGALWRGNPWPPANLVQAAETAGPRRGGTVCPLMVTVPVHAFISALT